MNYPFTYLWILTFMVSLEIKSSYISIQKKKKKKLINAYLYCPSNKLNALFEHMPGIILQYFSREAKNLCLPFFREKNGYSEPVRCMVLLKDSNSNSVLISIYI